VVKKGRVPQDSKSSLGKEDDSHGQVSGGHSVTFLWMSLHIREFLVDMKDYCLYAT
jgi:hypothetical protein